MIQSFAGPYGYADRKRLVEDEDVEGLIDALESEKVKRTSALRSLIVSDLGKLEDPRAVEPLCNVLTSDSDAPTRGLAAKALGKINDKAGLHALRKALNDESTANQKWAIQSLGFMEDRDSVGELLGRLESEDVGMREFAARALGEIGDQRATEPLIGALADPVGGVQRAAAEAIANLGDSRALQPLREAYEKAGPFSRRRFRRPLRSLEDRFG
jgi:HEAT repeat protein